MKPNSTYLRPALMMLLVTLVVSADAQWGRRNVRYARNYYPVYGQRVVNIPGPFISINFGGNPYYYSNGAYYRPYGGYYRVAYPPFGLRVNILPRWYFPVYTGSYPYYYSNGIFYRQLDRSREYEVIQAPIGAEIPSLPSDAKTMVIDGEKFYSLNGTYFKDVVKPNGELWFKVVGKDGVLNTYKNQETYPQEPYRQDVQPQQYPAEQGGVKNSQPVIVMPPAQQPVQQQLPAQQNNGTREAIRRSNNQQEPSYDSSQYTAPDLILNDNPDIGWVVDRLPENSKAITISNKKYFLSPNNTYYEEYVDEKRQVRYKVVGKGK